MPLEITMPQLSDTMTEGTLVKWLSKEGDVVKAGQVIAEVETDKATMEMEAFDDGIMAFQAVAEAQKVPVGALIAVLAGSGEDVVQLKQQYSQGVAPVAAVAASSPAESHPSPHHDAAHSTLEVASSSEIHDMGDRLHGATRKDISTDPALRRRGGAGERIAASPLARRTASNMGIDLDRIQGSGPDGRVTQADVLAFRGKSAGRSVASLSAGAAGPRPPLPLPRLSGGKQVVPFTKMRAAIAAQLLKSAQTIPVYHETIDIDLEEVSSLRQRLNAAMEAEGVRLSLSDFVMKAVAVALTSHPMLNARFNSQTNEITCYTDVNLGIAVAIPDGLIVPVLRGVDRMGLKEIRLRGADLIERARAQRLRQEEQTEATFSISSLGSMGVRQFTAIINPPEVAILAVGAAGKRPVVYGDRIVARSMMTLTLSLDHRVVDGAVAAEFFQTLKVAMEDPGRMLV